MTATVKERQVINYLKENFDSFFLACCKPDDDKILAYLIHRLIRNSKSGNNLIILLPTGSLLSNTIKSHEVVSRILKTFDDEYNAETVWLDLTTVISLNGGSKINFRTGVNGLRGENFEYVYVVGIPPKDILQEYPWLSTSVLHENVLSNNSRWSY